MHPNATLEYIEVVVGLRVAKNQCASDRDVLLDQLLLMHVGRLGDSSLVPSDTRYQLSILKIPTWTLITIVSKETSI